MVETFLFWVTMLSLGVHPKLGTKEATEKNKILTICKLAR